MVTFVIDVTEIGQLSLKVPGDGQMQAGTHTCVDKQPGHILRELD